MSGIVAAAQSTGCCCRPQEGCTCNDPNRPGSVIDRTISSVLVSAEFGIDEQRRDNQAFSCQQCTCFAQTGSGFTYGIYGYRPRGTIEDPDCDNTPCQSIGCAGCQTFTVSASFGDRVALLETAGLLQIRWRSSNITVLGQHQAGVWNWFPSQVGYCFSQSQGLRVRSYCPFVEAGVASWGGIGGSGFVNDPNGAFININTGEYGSTPYGNTLGRLVALASTTVEWTVGSAGFPGGCAYRASVAIGYDFEWNIIRSIAELGSYPVGGAYTASYIKPCLAPTDTVYGDYTLESEPEYDFYDEDRSCGAIAYLREVRATIPQRITVS